MHLHRYSLGNGLIRRQNRFFKMLNLIESLITFLHQKVGYDKLSSVIQGLFISPYAATSLREYFATGFTDFYMDSDHKYLKTVSPQSYMKKY